MLPPLETIDLLISLIIVLNCSLLDRIAEIMKVNSNYKLTIKGHTDNDGEFDYNQTLSERRAVSGRDYLLNKGVNRMQIQTVGYYYSQPLNNDNTDEGKAKNRPIKLETRT